VSPLIRTESILDCPASVWSHSAQIYWAFPGCPRRENGSRGQGALPRV